MYFCDAQLYISIITAVFSVTWSSEINLIYWFAAQETFLIIFNVENIASYLLWKTWLIFMHIKSSKEKIFFSVTFDQFNASLHFIFFKKLYKNLPDGETFGNTLLKAFMNNTLDRVIKGYNAL